MSRGVVWVGKNQLVRDAVMVMRRRGYSQLPVLEAGRSIGSVGEKTVLDKAAEGENLDTQELPALEMPYGQFRPASGVRACMNGWLAAGGPHHEVMNLGHHAAAWREFCNLAGIEYVQV